jgi:hypothetical protein
MGYSDYSHGYSEYSDRVRITTFSTFIAVLRYGAADPKNHDYVVIEGGEFKKGGKIITFSVRRTVATIQTCNSPRCNVQWAACTVPRAPSSVQIAACHALRPKGGPDRSLVLLRGTDRPLSIAPDGFAPFGHSLLSACRLPPALMAPKAQTCA